ncbi:protein kinase [Rhodococcus sp. T2V]|uniref:serine/threonine-protein kinase n=1 Tax=Rhodococcus sp. T2V TaxID=3034164 RepID=UPI0023E2BB80|nr:serine/threonine-protein kinase [Rhodococcus sp. T2V]MDF3312818.1 protein kinase [Rhodococcus sp. T2V]
MSDDAVKSAGSPAQDDVAIELAGEGFDDLRVVGQGGFGVIYRCRQPALDRVVAIKVLIADPRTADRAGFLREQQVMGRLSGHPNIVQVLEVGVTRTGRPYLVMPFHRRDSLEVWINRKGARTVAEALDIGIKMSGALETAHRAGVLHRDIKPANILLSEYGEPQLTDFGIARLSEQQDTTRSIVVGSPAYTAPELLHGQPPTIASDIYGLGATLYTSLAGRPAFGRRRGEELFSQLLRISTDTIPEIGDRTVPDSVRAVVEQAMARDPSSRPDTAAAMGEELRRVGADLGYSVPDVPLPLAWDDDEPVSRPPEREPSRTTYIHSEPTSLESGLPRPPTVATKYRPPSPGHPTVQRARLLDRLRGETSVRLVLIHGPAGYGKTTVAAQYLEMLESAGRKTAWLTLDDDDNTPAWFLAHLAEAIALPLPGLAAELTRTLEEHGGGAERFVLTTLLNRTHTAGHAVTVVLDDWHRVTNPESRDVARFLLEHGCHHLQLVVTSRTRQGLPLSDMRVHKELIEIDTVALRFDLDESRELLTASGGMQLADKSLAELKESTDGWVAALQLASLSLRDHRDPQAAIHRLSGRHRAIGEYLTENVLDNLDPTVLDFLLATSVTERTCAALATALTGHKHAQQLLEDIEERDLFLARLDEEGQWFRYHNLFADYLRRRLERDDPERLKRLHRNASRWFSDQHVLSPAVNHLLAAGDYDDAITAVENEALLLLEQSHMSTLLGLAAKLPAKASTHPRLQMALAWAHALLHQREAAVEALGHLEAALPSGSVDEDADTRAEASLIRAGISIFDDRLDDLDEAIDACMARAHRLRPWVLCGTADAASFRSINRCDFDEARRWQQWARPHQHRTVGPFSVVYGYCLEGLASKELLELGSAEVSLRHAVDLSTSPGDDLSYSSRLGAALLGDLLYEQGQLEEAERRLDQSYTLGTQGGTVDFMVATYAVGAQLKFRLGRPAEAEERLQEGERLAVMLNLPRLEAHIANVRIRTGLGSAHLAHPDLGVHHAEARGISRVTAEIMEESHIRLLLAAATDRSVKQAGARARKFAESIDTQRRPKASLHARLLLAECRAALRPNRDVELMLFPLLERCARSGLLLPILDAGPAVCALVQHISETHELSPTMSDFLDRLLSLRHPSEPSTNS